MSLVHEAARETWVRKCLRWSASAELHGRHDGAKVVGLPGALLVSQVRPSLLARMPPVTVVPLLPPPTITPSGTALVLKENVS